MVLHVKSLQRGFKSTAIVYIHRVTLWVRVKVKVSGLVWMVRLR